MLFSLHGRNAEDYDGPDGEVLNSGWEDSGFLIRGERRAGAGQFNVGLESDFGRDIERPRNNSNAGALLLPVRELAPLHDGLRPDRRRRY